MANWDVFAGMMFPELPARPARHRTHHPARHVAAVSTASTGAIRHHGAVLWAAVDEDGPPSGSTGSCTSGKSVEAEQARRILAAEADDESVAARYADDAMWANERRRQADR